MPKIQETINTAVIPGERKDDIRYWLQQPFWHWMFSGTAEPSTSLEVMGNYFSNWRSLTARKTGLQIASVGVFSTLKGCHIHCLLAGRNKDGKTLADISPLTIRVLQGDWKYTTHRPAEISAIYNDGAVDYVVDHFICNPTQQVDFIHNISLLKRLKKQDEANNKNTID